MSIRSRLGRVQASLKMREIALLCLKTSQAQGGYADYWKRGEFQTWVSEDEEAGLLYYLAHEVNGSVIAAADRWREVAGWASLLGLSTIDRPSRSELFQLATVNDFVSLWRTKVCRLVEDVFTVEKAVPLISEEHFDEHEVLFDDAKQELTASHERAKLLVLAYNCFAEENGEDLVDFDAIGHGLGLRVQHIRNEWFAIAKATALAACGQNFEARDVIVSWLKENVPST